MNGIVEYILYPPDQQPIEFRVLLDSKADPATDPDKAAAWTHLGHHQCHHCPLQEDQSPLCPLAVRVLPFVEKLGHLSSIEEMKVDVVQFDRVRHMKAPVQEILGSLLGLYVATSDCPHTRFLRPMAHYHLPLADADETVYRVLSMYRLAQYFRKEKTGKAYAGFGRLNDLYDNMAEVNRKLDRRMRSALEGQDDRQDGTINAIAILDALSLYVPASIDDAIEDLEPIFSGYWEDIQ